MISGSHVSDSSALAAPGVWARSAREQPRTRTRTFGAFLLGLVLVAPYFVPFGSAPPIPVGAIATMVLVPYLILRYPLEGIDKWILAFGLANTLVWLIKLLEPGAFRYNVHLFLFSTQTWVFMVSVLLRHMISSERIEEYVRGLVKASVLVAAIITLENGVSGWLFNYHFLGRLVYQFGNYVPIMLAGMAILCLGLAWKGSARTALFYWVGTFLLLWVVERTTSDTSFIIGCMGCVVVILARVGFAVDSFYRPVILALGIFTVIGFLVLYIWNLTDTSLVESAKIMSLHGRTEIWYDLIVDTHSRGLDALVGPSIPAVSSRHGLRLTVGENQYMRVLTAQGILVALLYLGISLYILMRMVRLGWRSLVAGDQMGFALATVLVLLLSLASQTLTISVQPYSAVLTWFLVGLGLEYEKATRRVPEAWPGSEDSQQSSETQHMSERPYPWA